MKEWVVEAYALKNPRFAKPHMYEDWSPVFGSKTLDPGHIDHEQMTPVTLDQALFYMVNEKKWNTLSYAFRLRNVNTGEVIPRDAICE